MNRTEIIMICFSFLAGLGIGSFFFMGLWWTILKRLSLKYSVLFLWVSFLLRAIVTLLSFYFVSGGQPLRLVAILLGFVLAKKAVVRMKAQT